MRKLQLFIKRAFDILVSLILILILIAIPFLIVIPITIRIDSRGPAMFRQERTGRNGKTFKIYKFRTMLLPEDRVRDGKTLVPNESITRVGKFLRKTSLDELPQLFNILNGTMSFVGPRPMLPNRIEQLEGRQRRRQDMRPGMTGWAQVHGRNNLTWAEKLEYDLYYVDHFSLKLDISIFFKTVKTVLRHEGIAYIHVNDNKAVKETDSQSAK